MSVCTYAFYHRSCSVFINPMYVQRCWEIIRSLSRKVQPGTHLILRYRRRWKIYVLCFDSQFVILGALGQVDMTLRTVSFCSFPHFSGSGASSGCHCSGWGIWNRGPALSDWSFRNIATSEKWLNTVAHHWISDESPTIHQSDHCCHIDTDQLF